MRREIILVAGAMAAWAVRALLPLIPCERTRPRSVIAAAAALIALAIHVAWVPLRSVIAGHAPFTNIYESLVFFSLLLNAKAMAGRNEPPSVADSLKFLPGVIALALALALPSGMRVPSPASPALSSAWIYVHVPSIFLGYVSLLLAFIRSLASLRGNPGERDGGFRETKLAYLFLAIGIVTGAFWADAAWGVFWSWDAKETWALATWLLVALSLHMKGRRKRALVLGLASAAMLFTYFGVTFLLPGLHSYA